MLNDIVANCEECGYDLFPVFEIVKMTESEFKKLPEFTGYWQNKPYAFKGEIRWATKLRWQKN